MLHNYIARSGRLARGLHGSSEQRFVDHVRVQVIGGAGGKGVVAFESVDHWKKRPVGGTGGRGGDVIIEACASVQDLHFTSFVIRGRDGGDASGKAGKNGHAGRPKRVMVPLGTLVKAVRRIYDLRDPAGLLREGVDEGASSQHESDSCTMLLGEASNALSEERGVSRVSRGGLLFREEVTVLADLEGVGDAVVAARGGSPGVGNRGSALSFTEQKSDVLRPHVGGGRGEASFLELELKSIADIGLVGFPNAGKSSLLAAFSRAKPKVAAYPFTTLRPHVGIVTFRDGFSFSVADIPGIVEGSHADRGLGHEFLRHIERTRVLLYVVDASSTHRSDPVGDLAAVREELRLHDPVLLTRPALVLANKSDLREGSDTIVALRRATTLPVLEVSALSRDGVSEALDAMRWVLVRSHESRT